MPLKNGDELVSRDLINVNFRDVISTDCKLWRIRLNDTLAVFITMHWDEKGQVPCLPIQTVRVVREMVCDHNI